MRLLKIRRRQPGLGWRRLSAFVGAWLAAALVLTGVPAAAANSGPVCALLGALVPCDQPGATPVQSPPGSPAQTPAPAPAAAPALVMPPEQPTDTRPGPGRIWTLTSSNLKLSGMRYDGYADQDVQGKPVKTLHFTVDRLEITDLVQRGDLANGKVQKAAGAPGSVSTVTEGPTELYVQKLTGTLSVAGLPLARITLSPDTLLLPNLNLSFLKLPEITFKDVVSRNVDLNGGTLRIPGSRITLE